MQVETISTESLGNRGYLVHDGEIAVVIDAQRDYQRWAEVATAVGAKITYVLETHMHNDYVTGGYQLAKSLGATYVVPAGSGVSFQAQEIKDQEMIRTGSFTLTGLLTPGHTEHHMSYAATDENTTAVFTGGGILYGTVGRSDLVSREKTKPLAHAQYDSAQRLADMLEDTASIFPTHGFGSFCSSSAGTGASESTLGSEKKHNIVFTTERDEFVRQIIAGLGPYPRYYAHMGQANQAGPAPVEQLHVHANSPEDIAHQLQQKNTWVIDIRSRTLFAAHHPQGALGIELGQSFATYLGWLVPWSDNILLVGDTEQMLQEAYTELSRIGMDPFVQGATSDVSAYLAAAPKASYRVVSFDGLKALSETRQPVVLDVRLASDWGISHIPASINLPLHELMARLEELPASEEIWVHCASGYRASIASSILDRFGYTPVLINDSYEKAIELALIGR